MKVGIDASRAFSKKRTGIEEYSYQLVCYLTQVVDSQNQFFLYVRKGAEVDLKLPSNFFLREVEGNFLWTQFHLSRQLQKEKVDVFFVPAYTIPVFHPKQTVVTVHGLEYKNFPKCYSLKGRLLLEVNTFLSVIWSKKIIVPSQSTKADLVKFYKVNSAKIKVINHGIDLKNKNLEKFSGKEFNILFIGRIEKRKNIEGIINAFDIFMRNVAVKNKDAIRLILAGKEGFGYKDIKQAAAKSKWRNNIAFLSYVSETEKEALYRKADLFLFVSFYEGFGIPVLEAMSYQVPVICSATSSLKEVAGNAVLFVDPANINEIASAIFDIYDNNERKRDMSRKGLENIKRFSWEKCARETLETLENW